MVSNVTPGNSEHVLENLSFFVSPIMQSGQGFGW